MLTFKQTIIIAIVTAFATLIANILFYYCKNKFNWFDENKRFKRDYSYKQLENLYLYLYAIICQSEYLRYFHELEKDFNKIPFLEITLKQYSRKPDFFDGKIKNEEFTIKDAITEFNKKNMVQFIIDNARYSSEKLLKLAVAYRYVNEHYMDNSIDEDLLNKFRAQELILLNAIVKIIVKDTNQKLKICNMDCNELELETGIINNTIYESP